MEHDFFSVRVMTSCVRVRLIASYFKTIASLSFSKYDSIKTSDAFEIYYTGIVAIETNTFDLAALDSSPVDGMTAWKP